MNRKIIILVLCITTLMLCSCGAGKSKNNKNHNVFVQSSEYKKKYADRMRAYREYYDELNNDDIDGLVMLNKDRLPYMVFVEYSENYEYNPITIVDYKNGQAEVIGELTGEWYYETYYNYDYCIIRTYNGEDDQRDNWWLFDGENLLGKKIYAIDEDEDSEYDEDLEFDDESWEKEKSKEKEEVKELLKDYPSILEMRYIYYDISTKPYKCIGYKLCEDIETNHHSYYCYDQSKLTLNKFH